jgi:hypothetical protein
MSTPGALFGLLALASSGCLIPLGIPFGTAGGVDQPTVNQLAREIPLYEAANLGPRSYTRLHKLSAFFCENTVLNGGDYKDQLVAILRQEAKSLGANAITDLDCGKGGGVTGAPCVASVTCSVSAIRIDEAAKTN